MAASPPSLSIAEPTAPVTSQRRQTNRHSSYNFLQSLRSSALKDTLPTIPSPTYAKPIDATSFIPRTARFSTNFDDLRKSFTNFSIKSYDSDATSAEHEYHTSARSTRWSSVSGSTSILTSTTSPAPDRYRKQVTMMAGRREYDVRRRKWIHERYQQECYVAHCKKIREERRAINLRTIPNYVALVDSETSKFEVQEMFLRPLAVQANETLTKREGDNITQEVRAQHEQSLKKLSQEVCEAVMSLH